MREEVGQYFEMENGDKVVSDLREVTSCFEALKGSCFSFKGLLKVDSIYTVFIQKYKQCFPRTCSRCLRGKTELT
jgi:hypothetical protein